MAAEDILIIANPAAQNGNGAAAADRILPLLQRRLGEEARAVLTQGVGHAVELAKQAAGVGAVVALGGDGLIHEISNGLMCLPERERPALGVVPMGSGNDYSSSLGMSDDLERAAAQLADSPVWHADVGCCNGEWFVETLSFGLDAAIALDTMERRKRTGARGAWLYMQSGIDQIVHHLDYHLMRAAFESPIPLNGNAQSTPRAFAPDAAVSKFRDSSIILCAVQLGPTYGGGFLVCPDARLDDGMLDICVCHAPMGMAKAAFVFLRAKNGGHLNYHEIELFRARSAVFSFSEPVPAQIDGERIDAQEFNVSVHPRSLRVLAPVGKSFSQPPVK